jgi:taurine transport system ATP-binding protein
MSVLNIDDITARYNSNSLDSNWVLENLSLQVKHDDLLVILGPSGCGKSTLLNLVAGFTQPVKGRIELNGQLVTGPAAERGVISQQDALLPWLNVLDNVAFGLQLQGVSKLERQQTARELLGLVGLQHFELHQVWTLSGGMKQRVSLARALAANPQLLLMDEPFGALDAFTREQMQELLLKVWKQTRKQIILITHDIEEAVFLATELVLMTPRPGKIVERFNLDFGQRYIQGESARQLKSDPSFIQMREQVLDWFFSQPGNSARSVH